MALIVLTEVTENTEKSVNTEITEFTQSTRRLTSRAVVVAAGRGRTAGPRIETRPGSQAPHVN